MNEEKISLPCFAAFLGINHTSIAQASWKITFKMIQEIILSIFLNNEALTIKKTVVNHDGILQPKHDQALFLALTLCNRFFKLR